MKRIIALTLLCSLATALAQTAGAQTRPRRVGSPPSSQQQNPQTQPRPETRPQTNDPSQTARPSRPPVLGGANRDPNEQKPGAGQQKDAGPEDVSEGDIVRVNTTLVSIPVSVMDRDGKYIPNLRKEDFRVWEDGVEQRVAYFASTEKPFTVALLIDTSGSTRFKLEEIQGAAIAFVNQLRPDDRVMVVSFDDKIRVLSQSTNDRSALRNAILQTRIGSGTRLYDAVDQVINQHFNRIEGRKAIVLFTDGVDTTSKHATYESTVRDAEELDALVYPVQFDTYSDATGSAPSSGRYPQSGSDVFAEILGEIFGGNSGRNGGGRHGGGWPGGGANGSRGDYEIADRYLHQLADTTGARLYQADSTQNLSHAFANVAEELRRQYSIGYYPKNPAQAGQRRQIRVRVNQPDVAVRARDSYVFNPQANPSAQTNHPAQSAPVLKKKLSQSAGAVDNFVGR